MKRMKKSKLVKAMVVLIGLFILPVHVMACACCADENDYGINFRKPTEHERFLLSDIKFGARAIRGGGTASDVEETFQLTAGIIENGWKLNLRDGSKMGTLTLTLPLKMLSYAVDPHNGLTSPGGGPRLYKEWRFEGRAHATGFLRSGGAPTTYFLVFQGHGNRCDNAEDFSHWRLELKGPRVKYVLTGELARTTA
jgi:hypothetical protein